MVCTKVCSPWTLRRVCPLHGLALTTLCATTNLAPQVLVLLEERRALEARHEREIRLRDAEVERLQTFVEGELASIRRRQEEVRCSCTPQSGCIQVYAVSMMLCRVAVCGAHVCTHASASLSMSCRCLHSWPPSPPAPQVEARAPLVSAQLAEARSALAGDLAVSTERAAQLRGVPEDRLGLADAVRLVIHDALQVGVGDGLGDGSRETVLLGWQVLLGESMPTSLRHKEAPVRVVCGIAHNNFHCLTSKLVFLTTLFFPLLRLNNLFQQHCCIAHPPIRSCALRTSA